jgi:hypothetical protein
MTCHCCDPTRRRLLGGMAALGLSAWSGRALAAMDVAAPGMLHQMSGEVSINGVAAMVGAVVKPGDKVATAAGAQAVFTVGDDGFLLRPDGAVTIRDVGRNPETGRPVRDVVLESGRVLSVFGPKQITLKTPLANVGIRGTAAYMECDGSSMNICVCYGHAVMEPIGAPQLAEEVRTRHHDAPRLIHRGPNGPVMEPYGVKNHTDEELVMLEALVGRVPAFMK